MIVILYRTYFRKVAQTMPDSAVLKELVLKIWRIIFST